MNPALCSPDMSEEYTWYPTPYGEYRIFETRFGLFTSVKRDGTQMVTGGTREAVLSMTPWHMHWEVHGYTPPEGKENIVYDSVVGGKL